MVSPTGQLHDSERDTMNGSVAGEPVAQYL